MNLNPKIGEQYNWNHLQVEVDGVVGPNQIAVRNLATGQHLVVPLSELQRKPSRVPFEAELDVIPEKKWEEARKRTQALMPLVMMGRVSGNKMRSLSKALGKSPRQLQRQLRKLREKPLVSALVHGRPGAQPGSTRLSGTKEKIIAHCFERHFLKREEPTIPYVKERIDRLCRRKNIPCPSRSTVERRARALEKREVIARRRGRRAAEQLLEPRVGSLQTEKRLQIVQIDHTKVDVIIVSNDKYRLPLQRPYLTLAIDVHTRCFVGYYLSMDPPSATSVAACVAHTILPKNAWLASLNLEVDWPMHGVPKTIHVDNAKEFRGTALARGCDQFTIEIFHRPVGAKHWGGHVERGIGTLMSRIHTIPGTTFSNVQEKGDDYDSEAKACMTLPELEEWLIYEICMHYHVTVHRGLNMTPAQAWLQAEQARPYEDQEATHVH